MFPVLGLLALITSYSYSLLVNEEGLAGVEKSLSYEVEAPSFDTAVAVRHLKIPAVEYVSIGPCIYVLSSNSYSSSRLIDVQELTVLDESTSFSAGIEVPKFDLVELRYDTFTIIFWVQLTPTSRAKDRTFEVPTAATT